MRGGPGSGAPMPAAQTTPPSATAHDRRAPGWEARYASRLAVTDLLVIVWAVVGAQLARFGLDGAEVAVVEDRDLSLAYAWVSAIIIVIWMATLSAAGTRDSRILGTGATEYRRIFGASLQIFGVIAIVAFLASIDLARSYLLLAFPIGVLTLVASRWIWRQWLANVRTQGRYSSSVVLLGSLDSVIAIARELDRVPQAGYRVVSAVIPGSTLERLPGTKLPVSGDLDQVFALMQLTSADTVIVTSSDELPPRRIREFSWELEPGRQHLVVAPSLTDIGGPRIHMRPVAGLPLVHVETPRYEGFSRVVKRVFDIVASGALITLGAPFLALIAIGIRLSTPGDVLFRQERVGLGGRHFQMLKFRSMVVDAEARIAELQQRERAEGNAVMFKMRDDPRVTPIGAFLRRYSLDELPQLFNVFAGSMSLVGPRPPLEREVALYEEHVHRRFLVKPGITGLWQVSGRSNLSWEDTVRLDLYYVENWSLTGDFSILWRTLRAVVGRDGAY